MNSPYFFTHNKERYSVNWEECDMILKLEFVNSNDVVIETRDVPLLGKIDQSQLDQIIKDYWKSFVKNVLKDIEP